MDIRRVTDVLNSCNVVVMHDFFIDRIVRVDYADPDHLFNAIKGKILTGGGSIRGLEQYEIKGGNAVNLAYALSMLNVRCRLITVADDYGSNILNNTFLSMRNIDLTIIKGKQGYTVSLEFNLNGKIVNVMLSDVGDNACFGSDKLNGLEHLFKDASCIAVVNWASNARGSELASYAFSIGGRALHFIDPADIGGREDEFATMLRACKADILSINENECRLLCKALGLDDHMLPYSYSIEDVVSACKGIASKLGISVDVHTPICSATSYGGKECYYAKSLKVDSKVATGAGDVWDAGDIVGYLCRLEPYDRLMFANACAALYVKNATVPRLEDVCKLLEADEHNSIA
jgi:ribokinase